MKKILSLLATIISFAAFTQITVTSSDMPDVNQFQINDVDTYRLSVINGPDTIDIGNTGAGSTWDFSFLQPQSQKVDTFVNTLNTDPQYYLNFNIPSDQAHFASYAMPVSPPPSFNSGFQLTDVYYYFKESNSQYTQVGFGAKLNGVSISQQYEPVDVIYPFPLDFGDSNTSVSSFKLTIPTYGYYSRTTQRDNSVDGWGTLITPFGQFQTLRVRSELLFNDTVFLDTLGFGFPLPRPDQYEYKWLANNQGVPLLQINTQKTGNNEVISEIIYRDSIRGGLIGVEEVATHDPGFKIFPNPNDGQFQLIIDYRLTLNEKIFIRNILGEIIFESSVLPAGSKHLTAQYSFNFSNGIYFLQLGSKTRKFIINR